MSSSPPTCNRLTTRVPTIDNHPSIHPSIPHLFTHPFTIYSLIHSLIHSPTHSFIHSPIRSAIHSLIHVLILSPIHSFIHSPIFSFIHLPIYSSIHSSLHSPICPSFQITHSPSIHPHYGKPPTHPTTHHNTPQLLNYTPLTQLTPKNLSNPQQYSSNIRQHLSALKTSQTLLKNTLTPKNLPYF